MGVPSLNVRRYVRIPAKRRKTAPVLVIGLVAYILALLSLWVTGSILFSAFLAVLGMGLIVGSIHIEDRSNGRLG